MVTTVRIHVDEPAVGDQLRQMAWALESDGIAGHEASIRRVVRSARAAGVSPVLLGILADPAEPEVARLRAFGRIATALVTTSLATGDHVDDTAA